jgi:RHS repeat-associated protein
VLSRYLHGAEGGLVGETSPGGTTLTSIYLRLNGQPIGLVRGGQVYQVHADHLGRPEMLTNTSKAIVWRAENLAFDRKVATTSIGAYNLGFPGQYYDAEGASWQNWFRTYDGSVGRYTQSDPIGLAGGLNTYAYVGGNPLTQADPNGLFPLPLVLFVACSGYDFYSKVTSVRSGTEIGADLGQAIANPLEGLSEINQLADSDCETDQMAARERLGSLSDELQHDLAGVQSELRALVGSGFQATAIGFGCAIAGGALRNVSRRFW